MLFLKYESHIRLLYSVHYEDKKLVLKLLKDKIEDWLKYQLSDVRRVII